MHLRSYRLSRFRSPHLVRHRATTAVSGSILDAGRCSGGAGVLDVCSSRDGPCGPRSPPTRAVHGRSCKPSRHRVQPPTSKAPSTGDGPAAADWENRAVPRRDCDHVKTLPSTVTVKIPDRTQEAAPRRTVRRHP
jgi:hypothetical protein